MFFCGANAEPSTFQRAFDEVLRNYVSFATLRVVEIINSSSVARKVDSGALASCWNQLKRLRFDDLLLPVAVQRAVGRCNDTT
jgi:hypothetical protein